MSTWGIRALALLCSLPVLGALAGAAAATAPGKNGRIAFRRYLDAGHTRSALFTAKPDGSALRQITHPTSGVLDVEPDWSSNGKRIVFQRVDQNGCGAGCETEEIDVVNSDGSALKRVAHDPSGKGCTKNDLPAGGLCREVPAWSPDGHRIAFECSELAALARNPYLGHICVVNADGSNLHRLPDESGAADTAPSWSPDGKRLAVQRVDVDEQGNSVADGVFVLSADGGNARRVTPPSLAAAQPDWSPDGKRILFYSNWGGPESVSANLFTIDVNGRRLLQLTHASGGRVQYLSATYSPDGRWITFGRKPGKGPDGNADVFLMRVNGTGVRNVTKSTVWDSGVDWGPRR